MDLRADMVTQAQDEVKAHADRSAIDVNIQKIVRSETKQMQVGWLVGCALCHVLNLVSIYFPIYGTLLLVFGSS